MSAPLKSATRLVDVNWNFVEFVVLNMKQKLLECITRKGNAPVVASVSLFLELGFLDPSKPLSLETLRGWYQFVWPLPFDLTSLDNPANSQSSC